MGADFLSATWWTTTEVKEPTDDQIRQALDQITRADCIAQVIGDIDETDEFEHETVQFMRDLESQGRLSVRGVVETLVSMWREFFESLRGRDVGWQIYYGGQDGVVLRQYLTGGMSWGDPPTEAFSLWSDLWTITEDLAPGACAELGVFFSPFMAATRGNS